jgi:hypothetical protein
MSGDLDDFETFWLAFPRKEGKKDARKAWSAMTPAQRFEALQSIPVHVRFWNLSGRDKQYIPMCGTWLRGERWSDELEMPAKKSDADWWRSTAGIEAKAREVGIVPKLGEDWMSLKARVMAKVVA